jgi:hypothetical protein
LWWGLVLGLGVVATVLLTRVRVALCRRQARVVIDGERPELVEDRWSPIAPSGAGE